MIIILKKGHGIKEQNALFSKAKIAKNEDEEGEVEDASRFKL